MSFWFQHKINNLKQTCALSSNVLKAKTLSNLNGNYNELLIFTQNNFKKNSNHQSFNPIYCFQKKTCSHLHKTILCQKLQIMIHFYHFHFSYDVFTNLRNLITYLTFGSLRNIRGKFQTTKSCNLICQLIFFILIIYNKNIQLQFKLHKMPHGVIKKNLIICKQSLCNYVQLVVCDQIGYACKYKIDITYFLGHIVACATNMQLMIYKMDMCHKNNNLG